MALICIRSNDCRLAGSEVDMSRDTQTHKQHGDVQSLFSSFVLTKLDYKKNT